MFSADHPNLKNEFGRVGHYAKDTLGGFKTFILRGNVVDLAIGIVIGAAFTSVVNGLVSDIITPLVPIPGGNLSGWTVNFAYIHMKPGTFINTVISFLIVAFVLYFFIVRPVNALVEHYRPKEIKQLPLMRECPYCLQSIPLKATRCAYCTSPVPPAHETANVE